MEVAGYSETPLIRKLGIKPGHRVWVSDAPDHYWNWLSPLPADVMVPSRPGKTPFDFIHLFVRERKAFERQLLLLMKSLKPDGMIWVSWPKKASKVPTEVDENVIRDFALKHGLVDVKVCAVDETWSGLKLVIRVKDRNKVQ